RQVGVQHVSGAGLLVYLPAIFCVALRHDDGRPARRYHQHRAILAHGLVVEVDADDRVGSGVPGSLDHLADREVLGLLQLALVGGGTPPNNVADAGEHVPEGVRTQDRLAGYNPLVVVDVPVLECAGGGQQHAPPPVCACRCAGPTGPGGPRGSYSPESGSLPSPAGWTRPTATIPAGSWLPCPMPPSSMSPQPTSPV